MLQIIKSKAIEKLFLVLILTINSNAFSQTPPTAPGTILEDINGDGLVQFLAFGDSITRGVGDGISPGVEAPEFLGEPTGEAGFPQRLETWLGISVSNRGVPGERLAEAGIFRFTSVVGSSPADYVLISEGANDSVSLTADIVVRKSLQTLINITKILGKKAVLVGIPPTSGGHSGVRPFIDSYNRAYADLADLNDLTYANIDANFKNSCDAEEGCYLLNQPEGLHPNRKGYDAMAEVIVAALYNIDLLAPGGNVLLAEALGRPVSSLAIKSPPAPVVPTTPVQ